MPARPLTAALGTLGVGLALTLTGCSFPDVSMSPDLSRAQATTPSHTTPAEHAVVAAATSATPTPTPMPAPAAAPRPSGDLDTGSVTHSLAAGDRHVVVDYWTSQDARSWAPSSQKTVQVAVHLEGGGSRQDVEVTRFLATTDDGTTRTTAAEDRGQFVVTPPFSYTTALSLPPSSADATSLTLYVQVELLVETAPRSGRFFRQTVLDSIALPLLQEDPQ